MDRAVRACMRCRVPGRRCHFLPWDRPLLPQAVAWLAGDWRGGAPLDLARTLVLVPTRQAGRRLREALAAHAAERGQAVFPPGVLTPEALLSTAAAEDVAPRLTALVAWAEVFRELDLEAFREVFPVDPPARNAAWALRLARQFTRLQIALGEGGLRLGDVVARAGDDFPEAARWRQLGELEALHAERLADRGLREERAARIAAAQSPLPPADCDRIVILGTPDPMPLAIEALTVYAHTLPVEVVIFAPREEADQFDDWGRPLPEPWGRRELRLPDFAARVHLCADPAAQAERIAAAARGYPAPAERLGIGVADTEVLPRLESALARAGVAAFNPEGQARRRDALYALLAALAEFAGGATFDAAAALLRCPDILWWLHGRIGGGFAPATLLRQLDDLREEHLPPTLAAALAHAGHFPLAGEALAALADLRLTLVTGAFPANATAALATIFAQRKFPEKSDVVDSAKAWMETLREIGATLAAFGGSGLTLAEVWELALAEFGENTHAVERPAQAIDLLGWLELLWEDAPHLVVAGLNDGRVPDAIVGDAFLPEGLRVRLGLKSNAARFARDAYLLQALAAQRSAAGTRLDLLLGKTSDAGDPLRPSRLLLRCADAELPARVAQLFRELGAGRAHPPWTRAWRLEPRHVAPRPKISVTAVRDYLACPFRFYLRHVLRMEAVDAQKAELDARDFGTLTHHALQKLGEETALRDCADAEVLRDFLLARFESAARERYGAALTLPLVVQLESARQRLRAVAELEARERAEGWRTERVEWKFEFPLGGLTVVGKIDRIDRHLESNRVRVLDYKTSDRAKPPALTHLCAVRNDDLDTPDWRLCVPEDSGRAHLWTDLQLPLYLRAVAAEWGDAVSAGYFNLPKAAGETALAMWDGYTRELQASAERCAESALAAIVAEKFWPPAELHGRDAEMDPFAELFHRGAAASVAWPDDETVAEGHA